MLGQEVTRPDGFVFQHYLLGDTEPQIAFVPNEANFRLGGITYVSQLNLDLVSGSRLDVAWTLPDNSPKRVTLGGDNFEVQDQMTVTLEVNRRDGQNGDGQPVQIAHITVKLNGQVANEVDRSLEFPQGPVGVAMTIYSSSPGLYSIRETNDQGGSETASFYQRTLQFASEFPVLDLGAGQPIVINNSFGWDDGAPLSNPRWLVTVRDPGGTFEVTRTGEGPQVTLSHDPGVVIARGSSVRLIPADRFEEERARLAQSTVKGRTEDVFLTYAVRAWADAYPAGGVLQQPLAYVVTGAGQLPVEPAVAFVGQPTVEPNSIDPALNLDEDPDNDQSAVLSARVRIQGFANPVLSWRLEIHGADDPAGTVAVRTFTQEGIVARTSLPVAADIIIDPPPEETRVIREAFISQPWDGLDGQGDAAVPGSYREELSVTVSEAGGGEPRMASATADVTVGETEETLTIHEAETDKLIATSDPIPFDFESDPIAALESALVQLAATLDLTKSNDDVVLGKLPQTLKIRYIATKSSSVNNSTRIEVKIKTSHSNTQNITVNLPYLTETPTKITFRGEVTLAQGSASTGQIAIQRSSNSYTTFDVNAGRGSVYEDGNAQDGLYWERSEKEAGRIQLGRAAKLKPEDEASKEYRTTIPATLPALQAAGFEDLIVEKPDTKVKVWTRIKNQATRLYISSHGLTSGSISTLGPSGTSENIKEHWAAGNLKQVIFAGCSVLNIGNFNGWKNHGADNSTGIGWKQAVPAGCLLLGYNATAPLGNPDEGTGALHADTRILILFQEQLPRQSGLFSGHEATAMAWLMANALMEQRIADDACAITDDFYYFIHTEARNRDGQLLEDPHNQNDADSFSKVREIWRVSKAYWVKIGRSEFMAIPLSGRKRLHTLPGKGNG